MLILVLICVISGARIMISETKEARIVITKEDRDLLEELIRAGNEKGIDQYVRLSSLTGGAFIGSFVQRTVSGERAAASGVGYKPEA